MQSESQETKPPTAPPPTEVSVAAAPQQPWVAMQYPAAAMVMQHPMMPAAPHYGPHYMPYHPHHHHQHHNHHILHAPHSPSPHQQQQQGGGGSNNNENRTIWVGDLHNWMDEDYLRSCFASTNE